MTALPETGYLRIHQIVGDKRQTPPVPALIPVSKSSWRAGVKTGRYPNSVKIGAKTTAWRVEDIRNLIDRMGGAHEGR